MEETWYLMKRKPQWTYEYMMRDVEYWHESIRNKYNENPSAQLNIKEEHEEHEVKIEKVLLKYGAYKLYTSELKLSIYQHQWRSRQGCRSALLERPKCYEDLGEPESLKAKKFLVRKYFLQQFYNGESQKTEICTQVPLCILQ